MSTMSDRFYLNSVGRFSDVGNPNYVLHRGQYMKKILEEDVKCIILSTYGLNTESALSELHDLLNEKSKVPTLILHGDKGKALNVASNARRCLRLKKSHILLENQIGHGIEHFGDTKVKVEDIHHAKRFSNAMRSPNDIESSPSCSVEYSARRDFKEYSDHVRIERVAPQWLYPENRSNLGSSANAHSNNSTSDLQFVKCSPIKSEFARTPLRIPNVPQSSDRFGGNIAGVHHPKYILAFTSKGVHVHVR